MNDKKLEANEVLNISFVVVVASEDIDDIMCTALEGGINYWCDEAAVDEDKRVTEWGHEQIARGGELKIHVVEPFDDEDTEWFTLTKEKFMNGLKLYIARQGHVDFLEVVDHELRVDAGYVDADAADTIIQYALFGDIIYG